MQNNISFETNLRNIIIWLMFHENYLKFDRYESFENANKIFLKPEKLYTVDAW